jgi:hypothetical protein
LKRNVYRNGFNNYWKNDEKLSIWNNIEKGANRRLTYLLLIFEILILTVNIFSDNSW